MASVGLAPVGDLEDSPTWHVRLGDEVTTWDWTQGPPPVEALAPVRAVRSATYSRNVPVRARCSTTQGVLLLESGLEYELLMWLDWAPEVSWIAAQPFGLRWSDGVRHYPDLVSVGIDGLVTVWDARPQARQGEDFTAKAARTEAACAQEGWAYEVFAGLPMPASLNLRWIAGARRAPQWLEAVRPRVLELVQDEPRRLGEVMGVDDGRGFHTSVLWHLVWTGELTMDLFEPWSSTTLVRRGAEAVA